MENQELIEEREGKVVLNLKTLDQSSQANFDCLILLNSVSMPWLYEKLIPKARRIIASDGGANFLYHSPFKDAKNLFAIIGDLDSLQPEVKHYYQQKKVLVIEDLNQDLNDFSKAIIFAKNQNLVTIVSLGVLGGRIDQELCNLNAIQRYSKLHRQRFIAIGNTSLMFLVRENQQAVIIPGNLCLLNESGLVCFGKSRVITKGFKWQLSKQGPELEWSRLISSSNVIVSSQLEIKTQKQIFFTISLSQIQKSPRL